MQKRKRLFQDFRGGDRGKIVGGLWPSPPAQKAWRSALGYTARRLPAPGEVMGLSIWAMENPHTVLTPYPGVTESPNLVSQDI